MSSSSESSDGVGICGVLLIVFVVLKLTGGITWPWLWVLAPLWMPMGVALAALAVFLLAVAGTRLGRR